MGSEWTSEKVEDIAAKLAMGPFGSNIKTDFFVTKGVPVIRGQNLNAERFYDDNFVFLSEKKADELISANAFPGDLVFTHRGTLGQVGIIPYDAKYKRYVVSQSQMKMTCDTDKVDPFFLFYFFRSPKGQYELLANTSTTGVPAISRPLTTLKSILVDLPPLPEQHAITHILGTLDDKIELNRKINETLEAMARAIFKSWFVDFDPVRAKAEGRDPGLPKEIADLFPDSFEDSELGKIPKGWEIKRFSNTIEIIGGGTPKTSVPFYWGGDVPWFSVGDAPHDTDVWVVDTQKKITQAGIENSSTRVLPEGTTIISARGTVGRLALVGVPMAMNQSCYGLRGTCDERGFFTYYTTRSLVDTLQHRTHGSVFGTITRDTLAGVEVVVPRPRVIFVFEQTIAPLLEHIRDNVLESNTLAALSDTLLPKLISGEICIETRGL